MNRCQILKEAIRIENEIYNLKHPNSLSNTQYTVKLSNSFLCDAEVGDYDELIKNIKVKAIAIHKDTEGVYVTANSKPIYQVYELEGSPYTKIEVIREGKHYSLLHRNIGAEDNPYNISDPSPYIVACNIKTEGKKCYWEQGYYCSSFEMACDLFIESEMSILNKKEEGMEYE